MCAPRSAALFSELDDDAVIERLIGEIDARALPELIEDRPIDLLQIHFRRGVNLHDGIFLRACEMQRREQQHWDERANQSDFA